MGDEGRRAKSKDMHKKRWGGGDGGGRRKKTGTSGSEVVDGVGKTDKKKKKKSRKNITRPPKKNVSQRGRRGKKNRRKGARPHCPQKGERTMGKVERHKLKKKKKKKKKKTGGKKSHRNFGLYKGSTWVVISGKNKKGRWEEITQLEGRYDRAVLREEENNEDWERMNLYIACFGTDRGEKLRRSHSASQTWVSCPGVRSDSRKLEGEGSDFEGCDHRSGLEKGRGEGL